MSEFLPDIPTRREEEARIVSSFLQRLEERLRLDDLRFFHDILAHVGLSMDQVRSLEGLTLDRLDKALGLARDRHPDIMLRLLKSLELQDLGMIGYATLSCGTLGKALSVMIRYQDLTSDRYSDQSRVDDDVFVIRPLPRFRHFTDQVSISEDSLTGNWRAVELLLGPDADLTGASAWFAYDAPAYEATYREVFAPCEVVFGAPETGLRIPRAWLDRPVTSANLVMSGVTSAVCERMLGPGAGGYQDTPRAVRRLLLSRPGQRMLRLEEAADELLLSTARLRKRLYRAGTSYKQIVLEVRMALALHYLESTPLTVQEVAFLLDYSQPGPFSRAFKKYYGYPPSDVRRSRQALGKETACGS